MGITLTSKTINSTYDSLLKLSDNDSLTGAFKVITDGLGNDTGVSLNNTGDVTISGTLTVNTRINTPLLQFTGGTGTQGELSWNADEETVDLIQNGATLQVGQETHYHVKNQSGADIGDGVAVMAVGTLGASGRILIAPMVADGTVEPRFFLGVTTETIANGEDGKVTHFGKLRGIDTSAFPDGTVLWLDPTNAGGFTATEPEAPNLKIATAFVIKSHTNGTIFVRANAGIDLHNNHRVQVGSLADKDLLVWSSANTRWENSKTLSGLTLSSIDFGGTSSQFVKADGSFDSTTYQNITEKGQALGYAPLDSGGKIAEAYLPDSVVGQVEYQGTWNATTNTPTLPDPTTVKGHFYIVSVSGNYLTIDYQVGDWVISNGVDWSKVDNTDAVTTFNGRLGSIVPLSTDYDSFFYTKTLLDGGQLDNRYYTEAELNAGQLDNRYYTETELTNGQLDTRYYTETEINSFFSGGTAISGYNKTNWDSAYSYSQIGHLPLAGGTLSGDLIINGELSVTGTIDLSNADLNIGAADIIFDTISTNANRGFIWDVDGAFLSKLVGGGTNGGMVELYTNLNDAITTGDVFRIKEGSVSSTLFSINGNGVSAFSGNVTAPTFIGALTGNASTASKWATARTITLGGDLTGNMSIDGSSNVTLTAAVVNDSHTHDGRYYTETEISNFFSGASAKTGYNKTNWDTAYGWGNHASVGYLTSFDITTQTDPKYLRSDTSDTMSGALTVTSSITAGGSIVAQSVGYTELKADQTDSAAVRMGVSSGTNEGFLMCDNTDSGHISGNASLKMLVYNSGGSLVESARFTTTGVGIDTPSPSAKLDIAASGDGIRIRRSNGYPSIKAGSENGGNLILDCDAYNGATFLNNYVSRNVYMVTGGGKVGINQTSPSEKLDVIGKFKLTSSSNGYGWMYSNDTNHSIIIRGNRDGTVGNFTSYYQYGGAYSGGYGHRFYTGGLIGNQSERFGIANDYAVFSNVNVGINQTSPSYNLDINGGSATAARIYSTGYANLDIESTRTSGNIGGIRWETAGDGAKTAEINALVNGGLVFKTGTGSSALTDAVLITASNTLNCYGDIVAYYSSDKRLKDNIKPIDNALDKVMQIGGYEFDWNDKQETYEGHDIGVIAQEIEAIMPELVTTRDNGYKAVKYEKLVPLLIESIKELKAEIETLKNK